MKKKVNNCISCDIPCAPYCSYRDDSYEYYCDCCGEEYNPKELYEYDTGEELCKECLLNNYQTLV